MKYNEHKCEIEGCNNLTENERFCSQKCYGIFESESKKFNGENNINYKQKVDWNCKNCGKYEPRTPYRAKRPYCDEKCMSEYFSRNYIGKNAPSHRGGSPAYWHSIIMERDGYECCWCHKKVGKCIDGRDDLHNHHIYNREEFPELIQWSGNMLSLCVPCHGMWRGNEYIGLFEYLSMGGLI